MSRVEKTMAPHLNLEHIVWERFGCLEPCQARWLDDLSYWEDYTAAFFQSNGRAYRPEDSNVRGWLQAADRAPFVRMADVLLSRLAAQTALHDVEFVLLAHWLPDLHLGTSVTNFAMHHLGLRTAFGFAISDRGLAAPFVAFDCIDRYLRSGHRKALLLVMDQKHLLYHSPLRDSLNPDNNACIMLLERRPTPGLTYLGYRRLVIASPASVDHTCLAIMASLCLRSHTTTIITSDPLMASLTLPAHTVTADPHLVCAAPFAALSEVLAPNRDYLLLARDGQAVCGVAFRSPET
jgi:hypothetical protein